MQTCGDCGVRRLFGASPGGVLVVAAHPDDETIGVGATLGGLARAGWRIRVLHVTDGAPRDATLRPTLSDLSSAEAAAARRSELREAMGRGGLEPDRVLLEPLHFSDQEAALAMRDIAAALTEIIASESVDVVITHPFEGGHPDHDACAFAVHAAQLLISQGCASKGPRLVEMTSYHGSGDTLSTATFRASPGRSCTAEHDGVLTACDRARRSDMLAAFVSQRQVLRVFGNEREPLRCAPQYDFTEPPAAPRHYERLPFGWTGERFAHLARGALSQLGLA